MGFNLDFKEDTGNTLDLYLTNILEDSEKTESDMLKSAGETIKELIVKNLNKHRRVIAVRYKGRPAMADDVKVYRRTDKFGNKSARVQGGKMTGTLWHLVNDGNLHSQPTHFMDGALNKLDKDIDEVWDKVMK